MHRIPQRSYTERSIEIWFKRLNQDWEQWFDAEALNQGRHYYRTELVRSTELLDTSAIVHFKRGKEALYVIVDWEGERPHFRKSDPSLGDGLAVAGLYELEEMLADEISPVAKEIRKSSKKPAESPDDLVEDRRIEFPTKDTALATEPGRPMWIRLEARHDGLWLDCGWEKEGKKNYGDFRLKDLSVLERESLIRYTALAHRSHFLRADRDGRYRLQDPASIRRFIEEELSGWKRRFRLEIGEGVQAWERGLVRIEPRMRIQDRGEKALFRWEFGTSGESRFSSDLTAQLLKSPGHVHFVPGMGIYQIEDHAIAAIHEWKTMMAGAGVEGELPRYMLFSYLHETDIKVQMSAGMVHWQRSLGSDNTLREEGADFLRSYQREGVGWMRHLLDAGCHVLLADEMGLGKTLQILQLLDLRGAMDKGRVLIVCPASVVPVWHAELRRFYPSKKAHTISRHHPIAEVKAGIHIASYSQLRRQKGHLESIDFDYVILDEAQSIKNPDAKVTHACFAIQSKHRIALTGTPMENRPTDLWTIFRYLMPGLLNTRKRFEDRIKNDPSFRTSLRNQIAPFLLRRTKQAVVTELPPKVEITWTCPMTPLQKRIYRKFTESGMKETGEKGIKEMDNSQRMHLFALLTRLRQTCCDPCLIPGETAHWNHSGKLESLVGRLEEAFAGGSKVVIFSQFVQFLQRAKKVVQEVYPSVPAFELTGQTVDREKPVNAFREVEGSATFFISLRAGGTGLNLQEADYVFLLDPWWNPAVEAQAVDRVHRLGQKSRVFVYRFVTAGTIEEKIELLKQEKGAAFEQLFSNLDQPLDVFDHFRDLKSFIQLEENEDVDN